MQNIKLTLEYDGGRYQGWQQPGNPLSQTTVSGRLLSVIQKMTDETPTLSCGARTDSGVHALRQTVSFQTKSSASPEDFLRYLNQFLPQDIAVREASSVPERFQAALSAASRTYLYRVLNTPEEDVFLRSYTCHCPELEQLDAMKEAAVLLMGVHDFSSFAKKKQKRSTSKEILQIQIEPVGSELHITIEAVDFLYGMPRLLIGTLLDIGSGKRPSSCIKSIFQGQESASEPCSPKGLYLKDIQYPNTVPN